jgi:tetratricopeptide (TPR) repeat protein
VRRAILTALLDRGEVEEYYVTVLLPTLACALLDLGQVDEAANVAAQALRRAQATHNRLTRLDALRVGALIATRQERWAGATRTLEEALSLAYEVGDPYRHARLLHAYGQMHVAKGEPGPARQRLEAALAIFRRLGARKDAEQVERALAMDVEE